MAKMLNVLVPMISKEICFSGNDESKTKNIEAVLINQNKINICRNSKLKI